VGGVGKFLQYNSYSIFFWKFEPWRWLAQGSVVQNPCSQYFGLFKLWNFDTSDLDAVIKISPSKKKESASLGAISASKILDLAGD